MSIEFIQRMFSIWMLNVNHSPANDPVPTKTLKTAYGGLDGSEEQKGGNNNVSSTHTFTPIHTLPKS